MDLEHNLLLFNWQKKAGKETGALKPSFHRILLQLTT